MSALLSDAVEALASASTHANSSIGGGGDVARSAAATGATLAVGSANIHADTQEATPSEMRASSSARASGAADVFFAFFVGFSSPFFFFFFFFFSCCVSASPWASSSRAGHHSSAGASASILTRCLLPLAALT